MYGLHVLDIMDKHQLLIPTIDAIKLESAARGREVANRNFVIQWLREGEAKGIPPETQIAYYEDAVFSIRFIEDQPFEGEAVIPTLRELSKMVSGIIETFERVLP